MQLNKLDNIIFFKDVESNIIDQAILVLKKDVNFIKFDLKNEKTKNNRKSLLSEAEFLVNNEMKINNIKFEQYKFKKLNRKYKILKIINIILIFLIIFMTFK